MWLANLILFIFPRRKIEDDLPTGNVLAQFSTREGEVTESQLDMPLNTTLAHGS